MPLAQRHQPLAFGSLILVRTFPSAAGESGTSLPCSPFGQVCKAHREIALSAL